MRRPNLSRTPLLDTRPVVVAGIALGVLGLALTAVSVVGFVHARGEEELLKTRLAKVEERRTEVEGEVERLDDRLATVKWKQLDGEVETYQEVVDQRSLVWSQLLADLERIAPREIRLTSIVPSVKKGEVTVALAGVAANRDAWLELLSALLADPRFSNPVPVTEESPETGRGQGYVFRLNVVYVPREDA